MHDPDFKNAQDQSGVQDVTLFSWALTVLLHIGLKSAQNMHNQAAAHQCVSGVCAPDCLCLVHHRLEETNGRNFLKNDVTV